MASMNTRLETAHGTRFAVRLGIHTDPIGVWPPQAEAVLAQVA